MDASAAVVPGAVADGAWGLPTVVVSANQSRVLLSAPEGTTRRALDGRLSLPVPTLEPVPAAPEPSRRPASAAVCLPAASSAAAGGLHGALMTIADGARARVEQMPAKQLAGKAVPPLTLVGPPGTRHAVALARSFSRRDGFALDVREVPVSPHNTDGEDGAGKGEEEEEEEAAAAPPSSSPQPVHMDASLAVYALAASLPNARAQAPASSPSSSETEDAKAPRKKRRPSPPDNGEKAHYLTQVINAMFNPRGARPSGRSEDVDPSQLGADTRSYIINRLPLLTPRPQPIPPNQNENEGKGIKLGLGPDAFQSASLPLHAVSYLVETAPTQPKIDMVRAAAHGCAPGPHMRQLREGQAITLSRPKGWIVPDFEAGERLPTLSTSDSSSNVPDPADMSRASQLMRQARWLASAAHRLAGGQSKAAMAVKKASTALQKEKQKQRQKKDVSPAHAEQDKAKIYELEAKLAQAQQSAEEPTPAEDVEDVVITPNMITEPPPPGGALLQVYLPHPSYLDSFLTQVPDFLRRYIHPPASSVITADGKAVMPARICSVIHIAHPAVLKDERYMAFTRSLATRGSVDHLISSAPFCADMLSYPRAALGLHKVSHLDPSFFSVPSYSLSPHEPLPRLGRESDRVTPLDQSLFIRIAPGVAGGETGSKSCAVPMTKELSIQDAKALGRAPQNLGLQPPLPFASDDPEFGGKADAEVVASFEREMQSSGTATDGGQSKRQLRARAKVQAWNEYTLAARKLRENIASLRPPVSPRDKVLANVIVTPLGTGSASPSRDRNVSSSLVEYDHRSLMGASATPSGGHDQAQDPRAYGSILLDCGESTLGQLCRRLGTQRVNEVLRELRMIFISHKHADHLLGIFRLLAARAALNPVHPVYLVTCDEVYGAVREWDQMEDLHLCARNSLPTHAAREKDGKVYFLPAQTLRASVPAGKRDVLLPPPTFAESERPRAYDPHNQDPGQYAGFWHSTSKHVSGDMSARRAHALREFFGIDLQTVPVNHRCKHAYAAVLAHTCAATPSGADARRWALAYSGDTIPCSALAQAARLAQVDIMLHEATMGDELVEDAWHKRHSTLGQAVGVASAAQVRILLLTHFSQRYPTLPKLVPGSESGCGTGMDAAQGPTVALSFDLMRLRISEAWKFPLLLPTLELLYRADEESSGSRETPASAFASASPSPGDPSSEKAKGVVPRESNHTLGSGPGRAGRHASAGPSQGHGGSDWMYFLWRLTPFPGAAARGPEPAPALDIADVSQAVEAALVQLHGQAGGAVRIALVHMSAGSSAAPPPPSSSSAPVTEVVLRVARGEAAKLASALSATASVKGHRPAVAAQAGDVRALLETGDGKMPSWVLEEERAAHDL